MRAALLLGLTGCNAVFGLRETEAIDAAFFDAPADAPPSCPPLGVAPRFSTRLTQVLTQPCIDYGQSRSGDAVGWCWTGTQYALFDGRDGAELTLAVGVDGNPTDGQTSQPRLSQDGQHLLLNYFDYNANLGWAFMYQRTSAGWVRIADPPFSPAYNFWISTLAVAPAGDLVLVKHADDSVREWLYENGTWRELRTHLDQGPPSMRWTLSPMPDGMRAIRATFGDTLMYVERATLDETFGPPLPIEGAPTVASDAFLSDQCARLYLIGLGSVFFATQQ